MVFKMSVFHHHHVSIAIIAKPPILNFTLDVTFLNSTFSHQHLIHSASHHPFSHPHTDVTSHLSTSHFLSIPFFNRHFSNFITSFNLTFFQFHYHHEIRIHWASHPANITFSQPHLRSNWFSPARHLTEHTRVGVFWKVASTAWQVQTHIGIGTKNSCVKGITTYHNVNLPRGKKNTTHCAGNIASVNSGGNKRAGWIGSTTQNLNLQEKHRKPHGYPFVLNPAASKKWNEIHHMYVLRSAISPCDLFHFGKRSNIVRSIVQSPNDVFGKRLKNQNWKFK